MFPCHLSRLVQTFLYSLMGVTSHGRLAGGRGAVVYLTSRSAASGFRGILKHSMGRLWLEEKRWWVGAGLTFSVLNSSAAVKLLQDPVFWLLIPALSVLLRTMGNLRNTHYGRPFSVLSRIR